MGFTRLRRLFAPVMSAALVLAFAAGSTAASVAPAAPGPAPRLTSSDTELLQQAEQILFRECMEQRGFRYWITSAGDSLDDRHFPYVLDDVTWAREHGYGSDLRSRMEQLQAADPNLRYFEELPPARQQAALDAANGATPDGLEATLPTGGVVRRSDQSCTSDAERRLYGDLATWYRVKKVTDSLAGLYQARVLADPRFDRAMAGWSSCMRAEGYAYANPAELRAALPTEPSPTARDQEVQFAVAEATCAQRSGLAATARRLEADHAETVREQYRSELATRHDMELAALDRARRTAASG